MAPLLATVQAECLEHEHIRWREEDRDQILTAVKDQCKEGGIAGFFPNQDAYKRHCLKLESGNFPPEFYIQWKGNGNQTLDDFVCADQLENLVRRCLSGGQEVVDDWLYLYDYISPFLFFLQH
ncbi:hypothetical protein PspLS_01544 [Pyricularia sp. CBS 133598]|nr:hypothetical protein PspLS_01544 [Pyricularia sp. CBS 133598]